MIWLLVALCWIISFLFAGIEAGLLALDPVRLRHRAKSGDRRGAPVARNAQGARPIAHHRPARDECRGYHCPDHSDPRARPAFGLDRLPNCRRYRAAGLSFPPRRPAEIVVPPFPIARGGRLSGLLELTTKLLWPLHAIGAFIEHSIFARAKNPPRLFAGREELKMIAIQSEESGALSSTERAMIHNVVDFTAVKCGM